MKNDKEIKHHLAKRFIGQLGAHPEHIGKFAITAEKKFTINIKDSNDNPLAADAWSSSIVTGDMNYKVLLSVLDKKTNHMVAIITGYDNSVIYVPSAVFGFSFIWDDDQVGEWFSNIINIEDQTSWKLGNWAPMALSDILMLSAWLETLTQDGIEWKYNSERDELKEILRSFFDAI